MLYMSLALLIPLMLFSGLLASIMALAGTVAGATTTSATEHDVCFVNVTGVNS